MDSKSDSAENMKEAFIHDETLTTIFETENKSISRFFDSVFGYFYRNAPEIVFDSSKYYGKQVMVSSFEKWEKKYTKTVKPKSTFKRTRSESSPIENETHSCSWSEARNPGCPTSTINTATMSKRNSDHQTYLTGSKKDENEEKNKLSGFDTSNGASLDKYCWTQAINDIEVRVPVQTFIKKGNQVKVEIGKDKLKVNVQNERDGKDFTCLMEGELLHPIRKDDCMWILSPGQHISLLLEKIEDVWWDRLLTTESPIDLKYINAQTPYDSLPEEDRRQIEKVVEAQKCEAMGVPTSDQKKMEAVLRKAWDMEGSPFKGQPFDPSIVNSVASGPSHPL